MVTRTHGRFVCGWQNDAPREFAQFRPVWIDISPIWIKCCHAAKRFVKADA
jgi:hypothetical protein